MDPSPSDQLFDQEAADQVHTAEGTEAKEISWITKIDDGEREDSSDDERPYEEEVPLNDMPISSQDARSSPPPSTPTPASQQGRRPRRPISISDDEEPEEVGIALTPVHRLH